MRKTRIFVPGPTPLMPEAQTALARPIIYHRGTEFRDLLLETRKNLQNLFKTTNEIVLLTASGTGAMEAAVCNLLSRKDQVLAVIAGKFGERWEEICKAFRIPCATLNKDFGQAASAQEICDSLAAQRGVRAVLLQGCETSTATSHDLQSIGCQIREQFPDVLIVVDAVTAIACEPVETDLWGLDIVIGGSQKSFAVPPGLSFMSISSRALEKMQSNPGGRYYFDLLKELKAQREGQMTFTPAVSLVAALNETTREILSQGLDRIVAEADLMARCTRQGLLAMGFRLLSSSPSRAVTAAFPPQGVSPSELLKKLQQRFSIRLAGGQGSLRGRIIRIAHLGYFDLPDIFSLLSAMELCLLEMGVPIELGRGIRSALVEASHLVEASRRADFPA